MKLFPPNLTTIFLLIVNSTLFAQGPQFVANELIIKMRRQPIAQSADEYRRAAIKIIEGSQREQGGVDDEKESSPNSF